MTGVLWKELFLLKDDEKCYLLWFVLCLYSRIDCSFSVTCNRSSILLGHTRALIAVPVISFLFDFSFLAVELKDTFCVVAIQCLAIEPWFARLDWTDATVFRILLPLQSIALLTLAAVKTAMNFPSFFFQFWRALVETWLQVWIQTVLKQNWNQQSIDLIRR